MLHLNKEWKIKLEVFQKDRRAYFSFLILLTLFITTLPAEFICNVRPLIIVIEGKSYFPIAITYSHKDFGGSLPSEPDYKSRNFMELLSGISNKTEIENSGLGLDLGDFEDDEETFKSEVKVVATPAQNSPRNFWVLWPPVRYDQSELKEVCIP